jgi:NDP-sugar pyrophosphorylase family protein
MSVLLAKNVINNDSPLLIVNCHQYIDWDCNEFIRFCKETAADGVIPIFENLHPRYSYVGVNSQGVIDQVAEKDSISNHASCGVYYWKRGSDFVKYAEQMIAAGKSVNGNFYASLAFNEAIKDGKEILPFQCAKMWSLNNPKDLESFYTCQKVKDMK